MRDIQTEKKACFLFAAERGDLADVSQTLRDDPALANSTVDEDSALTVCRTPAMLEELLRQGADPNLLVNGSSALHRFAEAGNVEFVELLLQHGANIDLLDARGASPLYLAASNRGTSEQEVAELLIRCGAKVDLNSAVSLGMVNLAKELLAEGMMTKAQFPDKLLHDAIYSRSEEMVQLLLSHGVDPNHVGQGLPFTPLIDAIDVIVKSPGTVAKFQQGSIGIVKLLLQAGADPRTIAPSAVEIGPSLHTALEYARWKNADPEIVKILEQASSTDKG